MRRLPPSSPTWDATCPSARSACRRSVRRRPSSSFKLWQERVSRARLCPPRHGHRRRRSQRGRWSPSATYGFAHDLIRDVVYTELGVARRQVLHQHALAVLHSAGARASELAYHALLAGETEAAYRFSLQAGIEALVVFAVDDAIGHYEQ